MNFTSENKKQTTKMIYFLIFIVLLMLLASLKKIIREDEKFSLNYYTLLSLNSGISKLPDFRDAGGVCSEVDLRCENYFGNEKHN